MNVYIKIATEEVREHPLNLRRAVKSVKYTETPSGLKLTKRCICNYRKLVV